jgi:hypothetical protein
LFRMSLFEQAPCFALTNILSRWIRNGITSCAGPACRTCVG